MSELTPQEAAEEWVSQLKAARANFVAGVDRVSTALENPMDQTIVWFISIFVSITVAAVFMMLHEMANHR